MIAVKLDLLKCFDKIMPLQAIMVLRELGCPKQVADILEVFYNQYERWVEYKGACAAKPIKARL
eukprot:2160898-Karenia_brevis.AAC.1